MQRRDDFDLLNKFLEHVTSLEGTSRKLKVQPINREDGLILASLSHYIAMLGGKVFVDAGAGVGYSTSWILYGISKTVSREKISLYVIEKDVARYKFLEENVKRLLDLLSKKNSLLKINILNVDAVRFLENENINIDMIFIDIDKRQYIDILMILPNKLSKIGIGIFHNSITPGLDEKFREFLEKQHYLVYHLIPTSLGLLIVKRSV